jgi:uncharacterized protein
MTLICDVMLGKLARYLRVFGLDVVYVRNLAALDRYGDRGESVLFFTKRTRPTHCGPMVLIKSDDPKEQLREVEHLIRPYIDPGKIMRRCIACNEELVDAAKDDVEQRVPEYIFHLYASFRMCPSCRRVYWEGSHTKGMRDLMEEILA